MIDLIYTSANNTRFLNACEQAHWLPGLRSDKYPCVTARSVQFLDVRYKLPDFPRHLELAKRFRPRYATVPDLSEQEVSGKDITRALRQAEELSPYCSIVLFVPKLPGQIALLPKHAAIGYSMPTVYGGAQYPLWEIDARLVHLLGGSPHAQIRLYRYISCFAQVGSLDGNMCQKMSGYGRYWKQGKWIYHPNRKSQDTSVSYECLALSLHNVRDAWLSYFHHITHSL